MDLFWQGLAIALGFAAAIIAIGLAAYYRLGIFAAKATKKRRRKH